MPSPTTLDDVARALGSPSPPLTVVQQQFDGNQEALERLAAGGSRLEDLEEYALDLLYVEPLQPDLFRLVFPECLRKWKDTLFQTGGDEAFVQDLHPAFARARTIDVMLEDKQRRVVLDFFRETLLEAIGKEHSLRFKGARNEHSAQQSPYLWISYLASFGTYSPELDSLWSDWWSFPNEGTAIAALQYASCLLYPSNGNPVFLPWSPNRGGGPPTLWGYESKGFDERWLPQNVDFLRRTLTVDFLRDRLAKAVDRLRNHPEHGSAAGILEDLPGRLDILRHRVMELPSRLERPSSIDTSDWER